MKLAILLAALALWWLLRNRREDEPVEEPLPHYDPWLEKVAPRLPWGQAW